MFFNNFYIINIFIPLKVTKRKRLMSDFINVIYNDENLIEKIAKRAFEHVDTDNNGKIDEKELKKKMAQISIEMGAEPPTEEDVKDVLQYTNKDTSGGREFEEFVDIIKDILRSLIE